MFKQNENNINLILYFDIVNSDYTRLGQLKITKIIYFNSIENKVLVYNTSTSIYRLRTSYYTQYEFIIM